MKQIISFLMMLSFIHLLYAQPCAKQFAAYLEPGSKLISCDINHTVELTSNGVIYIQKIYHLDTKAVTSFISYGDSQLKVKHGLSRESYDDGTVETEGRYKFNKKEGKWLEGGDIHVSYQNDKRVGKLEKIDKNGIVKVEKNYKFGGLLDGLWIERDEEGNVIEEKRYINGVQEFLTIEDMDPRLNYMAYYGGCDKKNKSIQEKQNCTGEKIILFNLSVAKMVYSKLGYKAIGNITFDFSVDVDGQVKDIKIRRGLSNKVSEELYKLISKMPIWSPSMKNGVAVMSHFTMNVPLRQPLEPMQKRMLSNSSSLNGYR